MNTQEYKDKQKEYMRKYREEHRDEANEYARKYYEEHKDKAKELMRKYYHSYKPLCNILKKHHELLKDDPERLSTEFIKNIINNKSCPDYDKEDD